MFTSTTKISTKQKHKRASRSARNAGKCDGGRVGDIRNRNISSRFEKKPGMRKLKQVGHICLQGSVFYSASTGLFENASEKSS